MLEKMTRKKMIEGIESKVTDRVRIRAGGLDRRDEKETDDKGNG